MTAGIYLTVDEFRSRTIMPPGDVDLVEALAYGGITTTSNTGVIIAATNASPIVCETSAPHGMNTGDTAQVENVDGNTAANQTQTVLVGDSTHFSINGSTGNAAYTGGGDFIAQGTSQITASKLPPTGRFDIVVAFTASGTVGTPGITYEYSVDGGVTFSGSQSLGSSTSIAVPGTGAAFLLGAGTIESGQSFACSVMLPFIETCIADESANIDSRLSKRYQTPFGVANGIETGVIPFKIKQWCTRLVTKELYDRRGWNPTSAQDANAIQAPYDLALAEMKEAADSNTGLFDLPLRQDVPGSEGIVRGGPFGYGEASPYVSLDRQACTAREEDANGTGTGDQ